MILSKNLLIHASSIGNLNKVKELLENRANVYAVDEGGNTALCAAAMNGHLNVVKELLGRGAAINARCKDNLTPFELANNKNQLKVVNFLLNYQDNSGSALLHYAILNRNHKLIDLLLEKRADVNVQDKKGDTPLHVAIMNSYLYVYEEPSYLHMIRKLLDKGAKIYTENKNGSTPFELVNKGSKLEEFLLNYRDNSGSTLLHHAAFGNSLKLIRILPYYFRNVRNNVGETPLHVAVMSDHLDVVKKLSSRGADINAKDNNNSTPLHIAARHGYLNITEELSSRGADINAKDNNNSTPLHIAARHGYLNITEELSSRGADINAKDNNNSTPLHIATKRGYLDVVTELLSKGAKANAKNSVGDTPLHIAARHGYLNIIEELLDKWAKIYTENKKGDTPLHVAARHGHLNVVRKLLNRGAKTNAKNSVGDISLHVAVRHGHLNIVEELLDKWVKTNAKNSVGDTPLHIAARHGYLNIVRKLFSRGANIYAKNNNGFTPLELANNKGKLEVVDFLNRKGDYGYTLTHYAVEDNKTNLTGSLLQLENKIDTKDSYDDIPLELANGTDYIKGEVTSGAKNPFSLVNSLLSLVKNSISGLLSSRVALPETSANYSNTAKNLDNQYTSQFSSEVCVSNNVWLGFFLLQSLIDKKCSLPKFCSVTREEALANTLNIAEEFEKILKKTAKQFGLSVKGFDFFKVYLGIAGHVRNERYYQIPSILYSSAKEAHPENKEFLNVLKGNIEKILYRHQMSSNQEQDVANKTASFSLSSIAVEPANNRSREC